MRKLIVLASLLAVAAPLVTAPAAAESSVQAGLYGVSLRFSPAACTVFGVTWSLAMSGYPCDPTNGELWPAPSDVNYTHMTYLRLQSEIYGEAVFTTCWLDVPPYQDVNHNLWWDFFEVSRPVTTTTTCGMYDEPFYGLCALYATWSRAAGNNQGTCKLELPDLGLTFNLQFELIEYKGTLTYTYAGTNLTGFVELSQTLNPANTLTGRVALARVDANQLQLAPGTWTNALGQTLIYLALEPLLRDRAYYSAFFAFLDGDPDTSEADYNIWFLLISDSNDSNGDGIPDFTDPVTPASQPKLSIQLAGGAVLVTIAGESGHSYDLQAVSSLAQTNWTTQLSVRLTNATQAVSLPLPATRTSFWRAKTQ